MDITQLCRFSFLDIRLWPDKKSMLLAFFDIDCFFGSDGSRTETGLGITGHPSDVFRPGHAGRGAEADIRVHLKAKLKSLKYYLVS